MPHRCQAKKITIDCHYCLAFLRFVPVVAAVGIKPFVYPGFLLNVQTEVFMDSVSVSTDLLRPM